MTEADWQRQVTDLAELLSWSWAHFRPARTERGWRTPVEGSLGAGFPDLVLVRERVVFVELKAQRGQLTPAQRAARETFRDAEAEFYVWRPSDFDEVRAVLTERRPRDTEGAALPGHPFGSTTQEASAT